MADLERKPPISAFEPPAHDAGQAMNMIALAGIMIQRKDTLQALQFARRALAAAAGYPDVAILARKLLGSLVSRYHFPMMNDARRNAAWDLVLRRAIRPGDHVLEIGTGGGMLALMAARAGARRVTTCEFDPVLAALAREVITLNGYDNAVHVTAKRSQDLLLGVDMAEPADLLVCDIFADDLLGFDPLPALADARRLLAPSAPVVPSAGSIRAALGTWGGYTRQRAVQAAGFDISPFADLAPASIRLRVGYPDISLHSAAQEVVKFRFDAASHPASGRVKLTLEASVDGVVNGVLQWIRLQLDDTVFLEARPQPDDVFFSSPYFYPLPEPVSLRRGDRFDITGAWDGNQFTIWPTAG